LRCYDQRHPPRLLVDGSRAKRANSPMPDMPSTGVSPTGPRIGSDMNFPRGRSRRRALLVGVPVLALAATAITVVNGANAGTAPRAKPIIGLDEYYVNYVEPRVQPDHGSETVEGPGGIKYSPVNEALAYDRKFSQGNPVAARTLAKHEAQAIKTGSSPRKIKKAPNTQVAKLLTILVEFNENANDDFTDVLV